MERSARRAVRASGVLLGVIAMGLSGYAAAAGGTATYSSGGGNNWNTGARWIWAGNPQCTYNGGFGGTQCIPGVSANATGAAVNIGSNVSVNTSVGGGSSTIASITITGGTTTVSGSNTVTTSGGLTLNGGDFTAGSGTVNIGGTLTINNTSSAYTPGSGAFAANAMSLSAGSWAGGSTTGTVAVTGAIALSGSFTFTASSSSSASITAGSMSQSNTSNGFLGSAGTISLTGDLTLSGSTFRASSGTTTIGGRFNRTAGTFNANSGLVNLTSVGTVSHTFGGQTFNTVTVGFDTGLVGYWKLDETSGTTLTDSSTFGNNGTLGGTTSSTTPASGFSFTNTGARAFDGSTGYATLGTTGIPNTNAEQSLSMWVYLNSSSGQQNFIVMTNGADSAVQLGIKDGNIKVWGWTGVDYVSTGLPTLSAWHHIAYTWDGTTNRLYIDGDTTPATTSTAHQTDAVATIYLGTWTPNHDMLNGRLDDVRIYNRALTTSEISTLAGKGDPAAGAGGSHTFSDAFATTDTFTIGTGTVLGSGTLNVGGSFLNTGGTFSGTGAVTLSGTASNLALIPRGATFNALTVSGSGGRYAFGGAFTVTNNFTVSSGATVTGASDMSVGGNWAVSGTYQGTGAVTLTGTGSKTILSNGGRFNGLTINGGGTYTMSDRFSASGATVTLNNSTLAAGAQTARVGQFSLVGTGAFSAGTGTLIVDGTASQTLAASSFSGLRIESTYETGLVGYWKLDESGGTLIYDHSGNGNTGTLSSAGVTWQSSVPSAPVFDDTKSVDFDGSDGYADLGANNMPATNAAQSISFWANLGSTAGTQDMVALIGTNNSVQVGIRSVSGTQSLAVWGTSTTAYISRSVPSTGTWHHIAYVYDGAGAQNLYVDGAVTTATATNETGATTGAWLGTSTPPNNFYNGSLDDVRVYNVALTAAQVAALNAGRYAGTGGAATVSLGAATTVSGQLEVEAGTLAGNGNTMSASLATAAAVIQGGTYSVGSAAQSFSGGLTVQIYGALTLGSSGGSVQIGSGKALTVDGTLAATNAGATIRSISGTYDFWVGSTNGVTPTLNITGLAVRDTTANGMRINGNGTGTTTAGTIFTSFNNIAFSNGTAGGNLLQIYAPSLNLVSNGCSFDASTTYSVKAAGDGFTSEATQTRILLGSATCSAGSCQSTKSDDDPNNDGVPTAASGGAVVLFVSNIPTDTAGTIEGFPTAAFSWNDGSYYSTYVAFHDTSGTVDTVYVRDSTGAPKYSWSTPSSETIVGIPRFTTEGTGASEKHYLYVALASGKVYRLLDNGSSLTPDTATTGWSSANPYDCACTITTQLALDLTNLYWAGRRTSDSTYRIWALGQADKSVPGWSPMRPSAVSSPTTGETAVTSASPSLWISGSTYAFIGQTGYIVKANVSTGLVAEYNSNPGTGKSVLGRIIAVGTGTNRVLAGDDGGNFWSIAPGTFTGTNKQWGYGALAGTDQFKSAPIYDYTAGFVHFGSEGGRLIVLDAATGSPLTGYPMTSLTTDPMRTAALYRLGIVAVGTTTGKLFFVNRRTTTGGTPVLMREYYFGSTQQVSGIAYDSSSNKYMVTTSAAAGDGRLYMIDASDSVLTDSDGIR